MCKREAQDGCRKGRDVRPGECRPEKVHEYRGSEGCHPCEHKRESG